MDIVEQLKRVALSAFANALSVAPPNNGKFRTIMSFQVGDGVKPLLLVGIVHGRCEDGHVIAILNPDESLVDEVFTSNTAETLKELVAKRCDIAIDVWNDAYKENGARIGTKYKAQTPQPAKFAVV